jgi:probable HAF family extracellular repeat protein
MKSRIAATALTVLMALAAACADDGEGSMDPLNPDDPGTGQPLPPGPAPETDCPAGLPVYDPIPVTDAEARPLSTIALNAEGQVLALDVDAANVLLWDDGAVRVVGALDDARDLDASGAMVGLAQGKGVLVDGDAIHGLGEVEPRAIDERRRVAVDTIHDGVPTAALWDRGELLLLGTPRTRAADLSNAGHLVGHVELGEGRTHAFVWQDGAFSDLGTLGVGSGASSKASAVNDWGHVAGTSLDDDGIWHAVVWHDGVLFDLGVGELTSEASGINDCGEVVGHSDYSTAWIWKDGTRTPLEDLLAAPVDSPLGRPSAITDRGLILAGSWLLVPRR